MKRGGIFVIFLMMCAVVFAGCGKDEKGKIKNVAKQDLKELEKKTSQEAKQEEDVKGISTIDKKTGKFEGAIIYLDKGYFKNHYIPSGWMGDYGDIKYNDGSKDNPHSRNSCIKIIYSAEGKQGAGWAGIYWQNPANNWGAKQGGYDLTGASKLTFWARGENGGEVISEFKIGGISGEYADSDSASIGPIVLTKEWKRYEIDLKGLDLSYISGGFCWVASAHDNPTGMTFYLDDIQYEQ